MLAAPGAAQAASIELNSNWLSYAADPGEVNVLSVTQSGSSVTFDDPGKTLDVSAAGGACGAPAGGQVTCTIGSQAIKVDLDDGDDTYVSAATTYSKVSGGLGDDTLTGSGAAEKLDGDLGDDTLDGGGGADKLDGFDGLDVIAGGTGADSLTGGVGNDTLDGGADGDKVSGDLGNDLVRGGAGNDVLDGGADNDSVGGGDGHDSLAGSMGSDALKGEGGDDRLLGGADADSYTGGPGRDAVDWSDQTAAVSADFDAIADDGIAGTPELLPGDVEEVVGGSAGDRLSAGPSGTVLRGNAGPDTLAGGLGNDGLDGGADNDLLSGDGGIDGFSGGAGADRVLSRDGANEVIACGTEADSAEVDPLDVVDADCESVDDGVVLGGGGGDAGTVPPPQLGRSVNVSPARGVVKVRTPGGRTAVLGAGDDIPVGSVVDATRGAVTLTSAADANGATQTAEFSHGVFQIRQPRSAKPVTELILKGELNCGATAKRRGKVTSARGPHGRKRRRLWGSGHGRFRTRGRRSSATVRGTIWLTEDRCTGTYTKVKRGVVAVKDFRTGKTKLIRAGKSHFAKAKRSSAKRKRR